MVFFIIFFFNSLIFLPKVIKMVRSVYRSIANYNNNKKLNFNLINYFHFLIKNCIFQVNKMQLEELENNRFQLKSTDPNKPGLKIICYASTVELTNEWLRTIRNILQKQIDLMQALTSPIEYQQQQQQQN